MGLDSLLKLAASILACFAAAGIGNAFTVRAIPNWYRALKKPRYTPPNRAFGPIWTFLYLMMAASVFLVWDNGLTGEAQVLAFTLFWGQLGVNAVWSVVFFGAKSKGGGLITILALWLLILATIVTSFRVSAWAGSLLLPYIVWVSVAAYLNFGVWSLNRGTDVPSPTAH